MLASGLEGLDEYKKIKRAINVGEYPVYVTGLSQIHKAHIISSLMESEGTGAIIISYDDKQRTSIIGADAKHGIFSWPLHHSSTNIITIKASRKRNACLYI